MPDCLPCSELGLVSQSSESVRINSMSSNEYQTETLHLDKGWNGAAKVIFNSENARVYGQYIGTRYPGLPKILGGDTNRFWVRTLASIGKASRHLIYLLTLTAY